MAALQISVISQTEFCIKQAQNALGIKLARPEIHFNVRGRAAGQFRYRRRFGKIIEPELRFNMTLLQDNEDAFLAEVVPHEVAHYVAYSHYGSSIKPHGPEWKGIMVAIFQCAPKVTHKFDVVAKPRRTFVYQCECDGKVHQLGVTRHRRILSNTARYLCRVCQTELSQMVPA